MSPVPAPPAWLTLWTIYDHPADYPEHFVVREWRIQGLDPARPGEARTADTLAAARALIPAGTLCIAKEKADDPTIVESWL